MLLISLSCHCQSTSTQHNIINNQPAPSYLNHILIFYPELDVMSAGGGDPSLGDVYDSMRPPLTKEEWHIHDPSHVLETDGILMIAVTGKAQENGYK